MLTQEISAERAGLDRDAVHLEQSQPRPPPPPGRAGRQGTTTPPRTCRSGRRRSGGRPAGLRSRASSFRARTKERREEGKKEREREGGKQLPLAGPEPPKGFEREAREASFAARVCGDSQPTMYRRVTVCPRRLARPPRSTHRSCEEIWNQRDETKEMACRWFRRGLHHLFWSLLRVERKESHRHRDTFEAGQCPESSKARQWPAVAGRAKLRAVAEQWQGSE